MLILLVALLAAVGYLAVKLRRPGVPDQSMLMLQQQLAELRQSVDGKLTESTRVLQQQFGESTRIVRDVTDRLAKLDETNRQVVSFADQLNRLQDILKNPKQRGIFGEYYLEQLLGNTFQPNQYQMQYKFKDGVIVDAALFFGDKIIPIDSKFSLENYNRIVEEHDASEREKLEKLFKQDLKNRIDETAKYVRPEEGTTQFAFMFIPAEGIYYDLLVNKVGAVKVNTRDLLDYAAREKRVHIVSPTTFYVTLQAMVIGMDAYRVQESTKQIIKNVGVLQNHIRAYEEYFKKLGGHLGTTVNAYNAASKELAKIDKDVVKLAGGEAKIDPLLIDRPQD
ncbi:MAG: DNA recombination protein RmuC [bacterium]|nr:DNA recombination protein RmuC [bacterium]